jgi:hypothetical protein
LGATVEALYWNADSVGARQTLERVAPRLDSGGVRPGGAGPDSVCALGVWRLARGETRGLAHLVALLPRVRGPIRDERSGDIAICAAVLEAGLAAAEHTPDAPLRLQRLDLLMASGPPVYTWSLVAGNITAARLFERAGRLDAALVAVRRHVRLTAFGQVLYLVALPLQLRQEGRLMALTGDTAGAIRAYRRYLALRDAPDPPLRPEADSVRSALAMLLSRR